MAGGLQHEEYVELVPWNGDGKRGTHSLDGVEDTLEVLGFEDGDDNGKRLDVWGDALKAEPGSDPLAEGGVELGDGIGWRWYILFIMDFFSL